VPYRIVWALWNSRKEVLPGCSKGKYAQYTSNVHPAIFYDSSWTLVEVRGSLQYRCRTWQDLKKSD